MQNQKFLTQNNLILAIIAIGVCLLSFAGPGALTVHAFTIEELNIQIKTLQQQIAALQNQLNELQEKDVTNVPEKENEVVITQTVYTLTQNLRYGDGGLDVRDLQTCLKSDPIVYPEGLVTGYFGSLTKADVIRFQEKYVDEILKPLGLSKGTGFVGESTIAKLNAVCGVSSKSESTVPEAKVELEPEMKLKTDPEPKSEVDDTAPIILDITVSDLTVTSATMSWKTNEITKPVLYFGISTSNMTQYPFNVWVDSYQVRKSNLEPETTYYF